MHAVFLVRYIQEIYSFIEPFFSVNYALIRIQYHVVLTLQSEEQ